MTAILSTIKASVILWSGFVVWIFWMAVNHWIVKKEKDKKNHKVRTL